jgi:hypothetical protein
MREYVKVASDELFRLFLRNKDLKGFLTPTKTTGTSRLFPAFFCTHVPGMAVICKNTGSLPGLYRKVYKYINTKDD